MDYTTAFTSSNDGAGKPPPGGLAAFDAATPEDFAPVPAGIYLAVVVAGEVCTTRAGDDAYRMRFRVSDGPHAGRTLVKTFTFGPRAIGYSKGTLVKFGLGTLERLLTPFPEPGREYHVRLMVAIQRGDDGREFNDLKKIDVVKVVDSPAADFLATDPGEGGTE